MQGNPKRRHLTACAVLGGMLALPPTGLANQAAPTGAAVEAAEIDLGDVERFTDGDPAVGARLYKQYCRGCHGVDGRGGAHTFMPHVQNLTKKDYIELVSDGYLFTVIAEGGEAVGKNAYMPAWKSTLSVQDIKDVIAHVRSLPTY